MTYSTGQTIVATDFNTFATGVNDIWGTGTGDKGYGQTSTVSSVSASNSVTATQWTTLLSRGNSAAGQQGSTWSAGTSVTAGNLIQILSTLSTDITTITTNRLTHAGANLTTASLTSPTNASSWTTSSTLIFTLTWADQDATRAFFNSGGQIQLAFSRSGGTSHSKNTGWTSLCTAAGTVVYGYGSTTKSGGSGSTSTLATTTGYYQVTTSNVEIFKQFDTTSPYTANFISVQVKTNTVTDPGSRGGKGNVLTFTVTFSDAAADTDANDTVDGTFTTAISTRRANTNFLNSPQPSNPTYSLTSWTAS